MGRNRSSDKAYRAVQQKIQAGMDIITSSYLVQPTKAELRAMIPPYDESMVTRIAPKIKGKKAAGTGKRDLAYATQHQDGPRPPPEPTDQ
jgi:hypothetical protein